MSSRTFTSFINELPYGWNRFKKRYHWFLRAAALIGLYSTWLIAFRLIALSFITFYLIPSSAITKHFGAPGSSPADALPRFEEVSEAFSANELTLVGLSALLFLVLLRWAYPFTRLSSTEIISRLRLKKHFVPGALHGSVLALGVAIAFLLSGLYRFLGLLLQLEDSTFAVPNLILRIGAIATFVYCEEYLFRQKIIGYFKDGFTPTFIRPEQIEKERKKGEIMAGVITALLYCAVKSIQFDLGWMHLLTLFLVSIALTLRTFISDDFVHGAGFWTALLVVFHAGFSLPIFGNEFSGILLFKYQSFGADGTLQSETSRFLAGGPGGPLSGFAFQVLLLMDVSRNAVRYFRKKSFLREQQNR